MQIGNLRASRSTCLSTCVKCPKVLQRYPDNLRMEPQTLVYASGAELLTFHNNWSDRDGRDEAAAPA
jgi:hypothetical protein